MVFLHNEWTLKRSHSWLRQRWWIFAYAQPAIKFYFHGHLIEYSADTEWISSLCESLRKQFHRRMSQSGNNFIGDWVSTETVLSLTTDWVKRSNFQKVILGLAQSSDFNQPAKLTEFAALCLTDFIDWRYIHSVVCIFDPACELLPPLDEGTILVTCVLLPLY